MDGQLYPGNIEPMTINLKTCLPPDWVNGPQADAIAIEALHGGQSGARVFRVTAPAGVHVLKLTAPDEPLASWQRGVAMQQAAAAAGAAPRVVHQVAEHRAVLSEYIAADVPFAARYGNPATRSEALSQLARTLRRIHDLPVTPDLEPMPMADSLAVLTSAHNTAQQLGALPAWVDAHVHTLRAEAIPATDRAPVLSHNDVNPTNIACVGDRLVLLDWQTAAMNDPYYDLATASVFLRMDTATSAALLSAYDGRSTTPHEAMTLPPRFSWSQRIAAALSGTMLLQVAHHLGHRGDMDIAERDAPLLEQVYAEARAGTLAMHNGAGQWALGLALLRVSGRSVAVWNAGNTSQGMHA